MARKAPQLAKLTRPRLYKPVSRERLFRLLDEKREHPVVWIVGPPGAGKTTLAASYLEKVGVPAIWYQIDPGDSDPATFFYYLKQAIEALAKKESKLLPLLTPEYLPDLPEFARRFLRDGFTRLPQEAVLVLDNYHDIAADSALHSPLNAALAEVPQGSNIIFLSRAAPPPCFSAAVINQTISLVSWEDLRLTAEETAAIAAGRGITDGNTFRALHEQSTGWIAGVTLMLDRLRRGGKLESLQGTEAFDTVFDYFAGMIFDSASEEMRELLMKTAFLPRLSAKLVEAVTGRSDAIEHIEDMHRRHLFTDRILGTNTTYQYHALFREFLRSKASIEYSAIACRSIALRAATQLTAQGQADQAFALFVEAEDWGNAEKGIIDLAPQLLGQGRWQTLVQWIEALPQTRLATTPWLRYWLGRAKCITDPVAARHVLAAVYQDFQESGDEIGQILCATTILEGFYFEYDNMKPMDPWIMRVAALLQRGVRPSTKEDDLRANSVLLMGAVVRAPEHSMLESSLRRVEELLQEPFDPNVKVGTACILHEYAIVAMDPEAERVAIAIAHPLLSSSHLSMSHAVRYLDVEGYQHYLHGRYAQAFDCFNTAEEMERESDTHGGPSKRLAYYRGLCERRAGLLDQAEETVRLIESEPKHAKGEAYTGLYNLKAVVAFDRGDIHRALEFIDKSYSANVSAGNFNGMVLVGTVAANMAIAASRYGLAAQMIGQLRHIEYGRVAENYLAAIALNEAWLAHRNGDIESRDVLLRDALRRACDERAKVRLRWYTNALAEMLPIALSQGIESDVVRELAREFSVVPEPRDIDNWPWPVKVYTLGRFELLIAGESPPYSRKVPKKVLGLLKAIIAFGSHEVAEQKLVDALWPDEDGDAARRSLSATLHRLRKLLASNDAILQAGGVLSLNDRVCWVDAVDFESRIDQDDDNESCEVALRLYRGAFLAQEDAPWVVAARERLRTKFVQAIGARCAALEASGSYDRAVDLYSRGIEADNLIESFYQGLMRCYDRLDRRVEALNTYRRLREILSVTLGVPPSSTTRRLFETLQSS